MKIAFLLKGAISKATGKLSFPGEIYREGGYVNFKSGADSIKKHIIEANPNCDFDFFLHSWHPDLSDELDSIYDPVTTLHESNSIYKDEFLNLLKISKCQDRFFGQVSMCRSFKRITELFQTYVQETQKKYDLVIFYRYDVLLWKDMLLAEYSPEKIYVNGDVKGKLVSDFHFVMNYDNAIKFGIGLYNSISAKNPPKDHKVIKGFVENYMYDHLTMDSIVAGEHHQVIRKLMSSIENKKISILTLESFGLTMEELLSYNDII